MISTAAKMRAPVFLPQAREFVSFIERKALMRVMVVASCRRCGDRENARGGPRGRTLILRELAEGRSRLVVGYGGLCGWSNTSESKERRPQGLKPVSCSL